MTATDERTTFTGKLLGTWEHGSEEWHAARNSRIGGSDIAAVLGLSPWESKFSLWHRKSGLIGQPDLSDVMEWGNRLEDAVAQKFADEHPEMDMRPAGTYVHESRDYQLANPDRLLWTGPGDGIPAATILNSDDSWPAPDAVLEVKTARDDTHWGQSGTDQVPVHYRPQVLWYLDSLGLRIAHVAVLIGGSDYREYVIDMATVNPAEMTYMRSQAEKFMASVAAGERPDIDGSTATYDVMKAWPENVIDDDVQVTPQVRDQFWAAQDASKAADREKKRMASLLLDLIGDCRRAACGEEIVATRSVRPDGTTHSLKPARRKAHS